MNIPASSRRGHGAPESEVENLKYLKRVIVARTVEDEKERQRLIDSPDNGEEILSTKIKSVWEHKIWRKDSAFSLIKDSFEPDNEEEKDWRQRVRGHTPGWSALWEKSFLKATGHEITARETYGDLWNNPVPSKYAPNSCWASAEDPSVAGLPLCVQISFDESLTGKGSEEAPSTE